jgi:hypothetical protein
MEDKHLQQQLNRLVLPNDLEDRIRANWKQQLNKHPGKRSRSGILAAAALAGLTLAILLLNAINTTPVIVTTALNDIRNDAQHNVGISIPLDVLAQLDDVNLPHESMPLTMTKYCTLGSSKTIHLQVAGAKQGEVHLFIQRGGFDIAFWQAAQGQVDSMPWKLVKPRDNLSVLVLYTRDMNPANVEKLIQTMFYA